MWILKQSSCKSRVKFAARKIEIVEFHLDADPVAARQRYYKGFASRERERECEVPMSAQQFDSQLPIDIVQTLSPLQHGPPTNGDGQTGNSPCN
jgi:hypothetical protein